MSANFRQESAKILEFPRRPGATVVGLRGDKIGPATRFPPLPYADFGSGWYHEAAVQEVDRSRKS